MSYKDHPNIEQKTCYYLTFNVVEWIDIFTRPVFKQIIVESLNYFIEKKGLVVFGWCLMTNHLHLIAQSRQGFDLALLINEFKKFTTKIILEDIDAESEVRRNWIMKKFREGGRPFRLINKFRVWQTETLSVHVDPQNTDFLEEQLQYIHNKPVRDRIVSAPENYLYSSARDFVGEKGLVNIQMPGEKEQSHFILRHISSYTTPSKIRY